MGGDHPGTTLNPVRKIITTRAWQTGIVDAAALAAFYASVSLSVFEHVIVPANAALTCGGLCAYLVGVFVPGMLPQPVPLLGVPPRFFRLPSAAYGSDAIALTFDDGPHPDTTPHLLGILNAHGAKATFFLIGEQVQRFPELAARIVEEGHAIGVHGLCHRTMVLQTAQQALSGVQTAQAIIEDATGTPLPRRLLRPPYGFKTWSLLRVMARSGWTIVDWSLDVRDYAPPAKAPSQIVARFEDSLTKNEGKARGGEIVLLHEQVPGADGMSRPQTTLAALPDILRACEKRGLRCVAL